MAIGGEDFVADLESTVSIGDPTRKSHHDALAENTDFLWNGAEAGHDLDVDSGAGYHNGYYNDSPVVLKGSGAQYYAALHIHYSGEEPNLRIKWGDGAVPTVNSQTDGQVVRVMDTAPTATAPF